MRLNNSELWLDDMSFVYNPPLTVEEIKISHAIYSFENQFRLNILNAFNVGSINLFSLDGKLVWQSNTIQITNIFNPNIAKGNLCVPNSN